MSRRDFSKAQLKKGPTERRCKPCVERMCEDVDDSLCSEPTPKNGNETMFCSACGKSSNTLKKCTACKCVWYCDKDCQNKHRREHRKECKAIKKELVKRGGRLDLGNELDIGPVGKLFPREECPICMHAFPIRPELRSYFACCGKTLCCSCDFQHWAKSKEMAAERGQRSVERTCAFCRTTLPKSVEEELERLSKRVDRKDSKALGILALQHGKGQRGLPVDHAKCIDLHREAADHGGVESQYNIGMYHLYGEMGLQQNEEEAIKYFEKAAERGHVDAHHALGFTERRNGEIVAAMRHWRVAASGGSMLSMDDLIECCFEIWPPETRRPCRDLTSFLSRKS